MSASLTSRALRVVLNGPGPVRDSKVAVFDYTDLPTFRALWTRGFEAGTFDVHGVEFDCTNPEQQVLIVGNEPADEMLREIPNALQQMHFLDHFTAISWLTAWKLRFTPSEEARRRGAVEAKAQVAVIDATEASLLQGAARRLRSILAARDENGLMLSPRATVLSSPSLQSICHWLSNTKFDTRDTQSQVTELLRSTVWNALTSTSDQHHAISNVLGPLVLSEKAEQERLGAETLLRRLLAACGLLSWPKRKRLSFPGIDLESQGAGSVHSVQVASLQAGQTTTYAPESLVELGADLQLLLVDDQAEHGWLDWVKEVLPQARIEATSGPGELAQALTDSMAGSDGSLKRKDSRFSLALPMLKHALNPVLLLDLRLFSGAIEAERKFLKSKLLPLVKHFTDQPRLAWPAFSSSDLLLQSTIDQVENGILRADTQEYREALTWLPRVLALGDMSLPIVLFSSTGRRDLLEPLKPYGNIITVFEKPRLADLRADVLAAEGPSDEAGGAASIGPTAPPNDPRLHVATVLREAVTSARDWLGCRRLARSIKSTSLDFLQAARRAFKDCDHFELYHDESGQVERKGFKVVSLLAGFKSADAAEPYDKCFPVKFYGPGCEPKLPEQFKGDPYGEAEARRWATYIWPNIKGGCPPLLLCACGSAQEFQNSGRTDALFDPTGLDNINRDLLALLWENVLADLIPSLIKERTERELSIRLYGATRRRPQGLNSTTAREAVQEANSFLVRIKKKFGILAWHQAYIQDAEEREVCRGKKDVDQLTLTPGFENSPPPFKFCWPSLQEGSLSRLASEVLFTRRHSPHFSRISGAIDSEKGIALDITLPYGERFTGKGEARHLHYLADCLSRCVFVDTEKNSIRVVSGVEPFTPENGTIKTAWEALSLRDDMLTILNANRLLDSGGCDAEALVCLEALSPKRSTDLAYLSLIERLQGRLEALLGQDLLRMRALLDNLPDWLVGDRSQVPDRISRLPHLSGCKNGAAGYEGQWNLRRFNDEQAYLAAGIDYHQQAGYHVRKLNSGEITVFADLTIVSPSALPAEFITPLQSYFRPDGSLLGGLWRPLTATSPQPTPPANYGGPKS